jgi:hypothetical protein
LVGENVLEVDVAEVKVIVDVNRKLKGLVVTVTVVLATGLPTIEVLTKNCKLVSVVRVSGIVATGSPLIDTVRGPVYVLVVVLVEVRVVVGRVYEIPVY